jgi:predicted TIM-barrel fold metal-dependent hydrolase
MSGELRRRPGPVDAHVHAGQGDGLTGPWDTSAPLGAYLRRANAAGISKMVLFAAFHSDYAVANEEVGRIVARHPDRFFGFAFVHAERDRGRIRQLVERAVYGLGFCGIKVHRHDAPITREICETARALSLPVLYDVMGEVSVAELLAAEYPDVNFILPHLGSFADDWSAQVAFVGQLAQHPNIYTDTAGVRRFDLLADAVRRAGPAKVLFGSDGPWLHPGVELAKVRLLGLRPEAERLILSGNFFRLIEHAGQRAGPARHHQQATAAELSPPPSLAGGQTAQVARCDPWLSRPAAR